MFIRGKILSADCARPRKIPGWILFVCEYFCLPSGLTKINNWGFYQFWFSKCTFGFHGFHLKKVENSSIWFLNWDAEENLVVTNKDNRKLKYSRFSGRCLFNNIKFPRGNYQPIVPRQNHSIIVNGLNPGVSEVRIVWSSDNLSGSHHQSQVNIVCQSMLL